MAKGQKPHKPTDETRTLARTLSGLGVPQKDICLLVKCNKETLHKYYRDELDEGMAEANAKVAGSLFQQATQGNTVAAIFWLKVRMGWKERDQGSEDDPINVVHRIELVAPEFEKQLTDDRGYIEIDAEETKPN